MKSLVFAFAFRSDHSVVLRGHSWRHFVSEAGTEPAVAMCEASTLTPYLFGPSVGIVRLLGFKTWVLCLHLPLGLLACCSEVLCFSEESSDARMLLRAAFGVVEA